MASFQDEDRELFNIKPGRHSLNGKNSTQHHQSILTESSSSSNSKRSGGYQMSFDKDHSTGTTICDHPDPISLDSMSSKEVDALRCWLQSAERIMTPALDRKLNPDDKQYGDLLFSWYGMGGGLGTESISSSRSLEVVMRNSGGTIGIDDRIDDDKTDSNGGDGTLCLDINCTNRQIAIGLGAHHHLHSSSRIVVISLKSLSASMETMSSSNSGSTANSIETLSCCSAIRYHPERDNMFSFGTFSGSLTVFEVDRNDDSSRNNVVCRSPIGECFHNEAITEIEWIRTERSSFGLVSAAVDGKLLIWDFEQNALRHPVMGYNLISTAILNDPNRPIIGRQLAAISMTNIAFADHESRCLLIATPCGAILNVVIDSLSRRHRTNEFESELTSKDAVYDPLTLRFLSTFRSASDRAKVQRNISKHIALNKGTVTVTLDDVFTANSNKNIFPEIATKFVFDSKSKAITSSLQFSPFSSSLFLRSSLCGDLQIYSLFSPIPVLDLGFEVDSDSKCNKIKGAKWSPIRPSVIAVLQRNELLIYDLLHHGHYAPYHRVVASVLSNVDGDNAPNSDGIELNALSFNNKGDSIYVADNCGTLYVHRLDDKLTRFQPMEMTLIQRWSQCHNQ